VILIIQFNHKAIAQGRHVDMYLNQSCMSLMHSSFPSLIYTLPLMRRSMTNLTDKGSIFTALALAILIAVLDLLHLGRQVPLHRLSLGPDSSRSCRSVVLRGRGSCSWSRVRSGALVFGSPCCCFGFFGIALCFLGSFGILQWGISVSVDAEEKA
jgi:hypothetical protein